MVLLVVTVVEVLVVGGRVEVVVEVAFVVSTSPKLSSLSSSTFRKSFLFRPHKKGFFSG